ncbi:MAG: hypothetical protein RLZ32_959 [Gemmatimonadota bacterium]
MKTQYYTAASLDGFLATPDDSVDWLMALGDDEASTFPAFIAQVGAIAMGASTYTWILRHADEAVALTGSAWPYTQPTWVFTHRTLPPVPGANVRFVQGDVRPVHAAMCEAAGTRHRWIAGGGDLAGQFLDAGLLDELIVSVAPVTLGAGKPLFPRQVTTPPLQLQGVARVGRHFAELRYAVAREGLGAAAGAEAGAADQQG